MIKLVNIGLALLLVAGLAGCGGASTSEPVPAGTDAADLKVLRNVPGAALTEAVLDRAGMKERWRIPLDDVIVKQAVVLEKDLVLTVKRKSGGTWVDEILAFDRASGKFRYQGPLPSEATTVPCENERYVFVFCGRTLMGYDKQIEGKVYLKALQRIVPVGEPSCDRRFVYTMGDDNKLHWINIEAPDKGDNIDWYSYTYMGVVTASPLLHQDRVYVGTSKGKVVCVNTTSQKLEWEYQTDGPINAGITAVRDTLLVGSEDAKLYRLKHTRGIDRRTQEVWVLPYQAGSAVVGKPAVSGNLVFINTAETGFHAVKLDDGTRAWTVDAPLTVLSRGVKAVHLRRADGNVAALDAETGKSMWTLPTSDFAFVPPAPDGGDIYLVGTSGLIRVLTPK